MVLFWCRTRQSQLRALSNQFKRCYLQIHESSSVTRGTKIGAVKGPILPFHDTRSDIGNYVRFFAAPVQAKPKYEEKYKGRPRMNEEIKADFVRLVTDEGHSVVSKREALERARKLDLDLVEVQADADPPVCKLMDYKKEKYIKQVKEKEQTKNKSQLLRKGGLKEVRITCKIDKHDLQTKADMVKRLADRGYRVKCMAVTVPNEDKESQDLGRLLSRLSALIEDFSIVESEPKVEAKQAYVVIRHIKFGPLKKGPGKKNSSASSNNNISTQSPEEEQSLSESDSETVNDTFSEEAMELNSTDDFGQNHTVKAAPEMPNRYAASKQTNGLGNGSENRYATMRPVHNSGQSQSQNPNTRQYDQNRRGPGESASGYGMFGASKLQNDGETENGPVEVNRYKKGPRPNVPNSRGDFGRENTGMNPGYSREKQGTFRR